MLKKLLPAVVIAAFLLEIAPVRALSYDVLNISLPLTYPSETGTYAGEKYCIIGTVGTGSGYFVATERNNIDSTDAYLFYANNGTQVSGQHKTFTNYVATFDTISMPVGQCFYVVSNKNGAAPYIDAYVIDGTPYASAGGLLNLTRGVAWISGFVEDDNYRQFTSLIVYYSLPAAATTTTLLLNGNSSNITLDNATQLNATAFTNTTGLPVNISLNGTLEGTSPYVSYEPAGLYKVFAEWVGNSTYAESNATLWANMTFRPPVPLYLIFNSTAGNYTTYDSSAVKVNCSQFTNSGNITLSSNSSLNCSTSCGSDYASAQKFPAGFYYFNCSQSGQSGYLSNWTIGYLTVLNTTSNSTINYTSPYPLNESWTWCSDSQTLQTHTAIWTGGSFVGTNDSFVICEFGCSYNSCAPNPLWGALFILIVIVIIIVVSWRLFA